MFEWIRQWKWFRWYQAWVCLAISALAATPDWDKAVTKMWVTPAMDRLNLVGPWRGTRPDRGAVCPPGETRQIWLDFDGHKLPPGTHALWLAITATVDRQTNTLPVDFSTNAPIPAEKLDACEKELMTRTNTLSPERRLFLHALGATEPKRNHWHHWDAEMNPVKKRLVRPAKFSAILAAAINLHRPIPHFVVWTPNRWLDLAPTVLPPALGQATNLPPVELCRDEYDSACVTVSSLAEVPLRFEVQFLTNAPPDDWTNSPNTVVLRAKVTVWPIRLPASSRMEVFTWNHLPLETNHLAFLKQMKVNWFTLTAPKFTIQTNRVLCDFTEMDASLDVAKPFGKGLFADGFLTAFSDLVEKQTSFTRSNVTYMKLLDQYLGQWTKHMRDKGWKPEDYAIQLWPEPGQAGVSDQDWLFDLMARTSAMLKKIEPKAQIMENPSMPFNQKWYDQMATNSTAILAPAAGQFYLPEDTRDKTWDQVRRSNATVTAESRLMTQVYLRKLNAERGCRRWLYFQREANQQNSIAYFRNAPWKSKWMGLEGVCFNTSWLATGGALENPHYRSTEFWEEYAVKGMYAWRDGMEDIQYLELLEEPLRQIERTNPTHAKFLRDMWIKAQKRVADIGGTETPDKLDDAIALSRRELIMALKMIYPNGNP
ncbi:MAG: hypothetical protein WCO56_16145 [Verrucomicrobiota bacterium]